MIRLRQVAVVAHDLESAVASWRTSFGLQVCYRDPRVAEFGLHNALMVIGDQFLEVVSPTRPGTAAGRRLARRVTDADGGDVEAAVRAGSGDGGYMAIFEVDDLDTRVAQLGDHGVRVVWRGDVAGPPAIRGRHLHPNDVGGTLVSIDEPLPAGSWHWAGPHWWSTQTDTAPEATVGHVIGIAAARISARDPEAMSRRWHELELAHDVVIQPCGPRGEGLDGIDLIAEDRSTVGTTVTVGGVVVTLV